MINNYEATSIHTYTNANIQTYMHNKKISSSYILLYLLRAQHMLLFFRSSDSLIIASSC